MVETVKICGGAAGPQTEAHFRLFTEGLEGFASPPRRLFASPVLAVYPDFVFLAPRADLEAENISEILANPSLDGMTSSSDPMKSIGSKVREST